MKKVLNLKLIDVTLRDGGYKNNFNFTEIEAEHILSKLNAAKLDYIEVGYRNGPANITQTPGLSGLCAQAYLKKCRALLTESKMVVMLHSKNINAADMIELKDCGVDLCRLCISEASLAQDLITIQTLKKIGLSVSANITRITEYSKARLDALLLALSKTTIELIYFADSNGHLCPERTQALYETYCQRLAVPLGFHAHDNLGLAQSNALAALAGGATYIDVSLAGFGKGIGNLKAELFLAYLASLGDKKYKLAKIIEATNYIKKNNVFDFSIKELLMGIHNVSFDKIDKFMSAYEDA